jgi:phage head maturation protease
MKYIFLIALITLTVTTKPAYAFTDVETEQAVQQSQLDSQQEQINELQDDADEGESYEI